MGRERLVEPDRRLALALEEVDLGLHEGRLPGDGDELVGELGQVLARGVAAGGEALRGRGQLLGGGRPARLVPRGLGPGLVDEQVDLLDLALDGLGRSGQACGDVGGRGDLAFGGLLVWRRVRRSRSYGVCRHGDLSPPAS